MSDASEWAPAAERLDVDVWCGNRRLEDVSQWRLFAQGLVQMAVTLGSGVPDPRVVVIVSAVDTGESVLSLDQGRSVEAAVTLAAAIRDALQTQSVDEFLISWGVEAG